MSKRFLKKIDEYSTNIEQEKIRFGKWSSWIHFSLIWDRNFKYTKDKNTIHKNTIKSNIFMYIDDEILQIKQFAKNDKIKFKKKDIRMCIWVTFQQLKVVLDQNEV